MLVLVLLLISISQAVAAFCVIRVQQSTAARTLRPLIPRMPRSREVVHAAAAPVASCADIDIEELPAGLVEGYKQHQAVEYHAFIAEEVSWWSGRAGRVVAVVYSLYSILRMLSLVPAGPRISEIQISCSYCLPEVLRTYMGGSAPFFLSLYGGTLYSSTTAVVLDL